jgi:hypothetical protein
MSDETMNAQEAARYFADQPEGTKIYDCLEVIGCNGNWIQAFSIVESVTYRPKKREVTRTITYPKPETEAPERGAICYIADPISEGRCLEHIWMGDRTSIRYLARGLVYLRKEDAIARAKAWEYSSDE